MAKKQTAKSHPAEAQRSEGSLSSSVFIKGKNVDLGVFQELTSPPIVRMRDMQLGDVLDGKIVTVIPSRQKSIKNPLIVVALTASGQKVSVPAQAVIASALLPEYDDEEKEHRENPEAQCPYVGRRIFIKLTGHKQSTKFKQDDGKTPREFAVYDIAVAKK